MESVRMGRSGLNVSRLGLGTMNFGTEIDEETARAVMTKALDLGISHFDTADVYPIPQNPEKWGLSESIVGRFLAGHRDEVVVATKCVNRVGPGPNDIGAGRKHITEACERSLRRLGTDYVDIYYLHAPELLAPIDETFTALDHLVRSGKVLYIGVSNFAPWLMALAMEAIAANNLTRITVLQDRYNLVARTNERDLYPLALEAGYGTSCYNPLGGGMLAGLFTRGSELPKAGRFTMKLYSDRYARDEAFDVAELVKSVADGLGASMAQVALAWILSNPAVTTPIVGAAEPAHLEDSAKALDLEISQKELDSLTAASASFA